MLLNCLFKALIVHVDVAHGLFFRPVGQSRELIQEGLIVILQLVLHLLFLQIQLFNCVTYEMSAVDLSLV
jgi:hypothetical protein